jgi:hypothetical protein
MVNLLWSIINLDNSVSNDTIQSWISASGVPSCFRFVFQSPFVDAWRIVDVYDSNVPMPFAPWTIIVASVTDPRFNIKYGGAAMPELHQASIGHWSFDQPAELGARMWHEILHCYNIPTDDMFTSEQSGFTEYLRSTGSVHYTGFSQNPSGYDSTNHTQLLISYYTYLTHKYMDCDCFREGCGQQPDVPSEDGLTPLEPSSDTSDMTKKLLYVGGAVALLLFVL